MISADCKLTPRVPGIQAWDACSPDEKKVFARIVRSSARKGLSVIVLLRQPRRLAAELCCRCGIAEAVCGYVMTAKSYQIR